MWRVVGEGPKGGLYSFAWGEDAMVMTHHAGHARASRLRPHEVARLHPSRPTGHALVLIDDGIPLPFPAPRFPPRAIPSALLITYIPRPASSNKATGGRRVGRFLAHAEHVGVRRLPLDTSSPSPQRGVAVAAAAAGGSPSPSTSPSPAKLRALRLQPPSPTSRGGLGAAAASSWSSLDVASSSHFASSYISFLDGGLAPSGGRRRERRRDARGQHACSLDSTAPAPTNNARLPRTAMHHLHRTQHYARLHVPLATPATPLAGLWRGVHPGHGLEVVVLDYSADGGVLRATKVTGDTHVPAGEVSWMAELRSRQGHLTPDEEDTFDVLEAEAWEQAGAWADEGDASDGGGGEGGDSRVLYRRHNVVACTQARGRLAVPAPGRWVGGRLWEYDDGAVGFAFVQEVRTVIRFNRVADAPEGAADVVGSDGRRYGATAH